ncbi:MAG: sigma-54-dependent Fis family transcriptional regulator [Deltaproteobacteria bacterium]|nr:sigma-54-dependent Fis family transcriptional regulator [Deltaproteobacteria bacterium]
MDTEAPARGTLLLVDDEPANLDSLERIFAREGYRVLLAGSGALALEQLRKEPVDVVLTDLMMPGMSGQELLRAVRAVAPEAEVVLMTAYGTVEAAVLAMKDGAYDFLTKPLRRHAVMKSVAQALEKRRLVQENKQLKARLAGTAASIVGNAPALRATMEMVRQAAPSAATVLLLGESGTGKELFARAVHEHSQRASGPFVAINCAAIPETILEAELFGHERGAFTGAVARKEGRVERANGGTLFLDEIGELSPSVQAKLLRVLQEGEIERLGGTQVIKVDCRVVAATNRDLAAMVKDGRFREDLFWRLNVIAVNLPPLRDRAEDLPLLANHFLQRAAARNHKPMKGLTADALAALESYPWPGNVRELENAIERAVVLSRSAELDTSDLPEAVRQAAQLRASGAPRPTVSAALGLEGRTLAVPLGTPMEEIELRVLHETLRHTKGDKNLAAQLLGIAVRTIYRKLESKEGAKEGADK